MPSNFDVENPDHITRLLSAVDGSVRKLEPFRDKYRDFEKRRCGAHYGDDGFEDNRPINLLELGSSIIHRLLAPRFPQAQVSSQFKELRPIADDLQLALNQEIERMELASGLSICTLSAINTIGVMEVGITDGDTPPDGEGYQYDPGHLFADPVLFEDLILDYKPWNLMSFVGHEFTVPFEWAKENTSFDPLVRKELQRPDGSRSPLQEPETDAWREDFEDMIRLRQLYLPRHKLVLLFAVDQQTKRPLKTTPWIGPEKGPYHRLCFGHVLGRPIPLSPMMMWFDLDDVTNTAFNKAADQAERQMQFIAVTRGSEFDGKNIYDTKDGDVRGFDNPKDIQQLSLGGADQTNLGMAMWSKQMLMEMGGNWQALAGLGPLSRTVGQDRMMKESASALVDDWQQASIAFQSGVLKDLAWWLWHNPISEYHIVKTVPDTRFTLETTFTPEDRQEDFFKFNIQVNPFSAMNQSPTEEASSILEFLQVFGIPSLQFMQADGIVLDWEYLFKELAHLLHQPRLKHMLKYMEGEAIQERGPVGAPHMPASTTRTYNRVSTSAATNKGMEQEWSKMLFSGKQNGSAMPPMGSAG